MDKRPLIMVSLCAVVLLVLGSLSNVVGYQTVQTSQQNLIKERINQRELLFETIVDIANNKEIQRIILKSQISRGIFPTTEFPVVTKNQLKSMYLLGVLLSGFISKSRIQSMIQRYQLQNPNVVEEINGVIEKDTTLNAEINQFSKSKCDCEFENTIEWEWGFFLCIFLYPLLIVTFILALFGYPPLYQLMEVFGKAVDCFWA